MTLTELAKINKIEEGMTRIETQLTRIADLLEGILGATDPVNHATLADFPGDDIERVMYNDDRKEIVEWHLRRMGKEPKD